MQSSEEKDNVNYEILLRIEANLHGLQEDVSEIKGDTKGLTNRVYVLERNAAVTKAETDMVINLFKWAIGIPTTVFGAILTAIILNWVI